MKKIQIPRKEIARDTAQLWVGKLSHLVHCRGWAQIGTISTERYVICPFMSVASAVHTWIKTQTEFVNMWDGDGWCAKLVELCSWFLQFFACACGFRFQALFWFVACCPSNAMFGASGGRFCVRAVFHWRCLNVSSELPGTTWMFCECCFCECVCNISQCFAMPCHRVSGLCVVNVVTSAFSCAWSLSTPWLMHASTLTVSKKWWGSCFWLSVLVLIT